MLHCGVERFPPEERRQVLQFTQRKAVPFRRPLHCGVERFLPEKRRKILQFIQREAVPLRRLSHCGVERFFSLERPQALQALQRLQWLQLLFQPFQLGIKPRKAVRRNRFPKRGIRTARFRSVRFLRRSFTGQQRVHARAEYGRKRGQFKNVRHGLAPFPVAYRLIAHRKLLGKLSLRQIFCFAQRRNASANLLHIRHVHFLCPVFLGSVFLVLFSENHARALLQNFDCLAFIEPQARRPCLSCGA